MTPFGNTFTLRVLIPGAICLAACLPSAASEEPGECSQWTVQGLHAGADMVTVSTVVEGETSRWRKLEGDEAPPRSLYRMGGRDATEGQRESLLVAGDLDRQRVTAVTWVIEKPVRGLRQWAEEYQGLWGTPLLDRYVITTGDLMSEASVWIDPACDVRATLLAERSRTGAGFRFKRLAIRLEKRGDPVGHLNMLLLKVRNLED